MCGTLKLQKQNETTLKMLTSLHQRTFEPPQMLTRLKLQKTKGTTLDVNTFENTKNKWNHLRC